MKFTNLYIAIAFLGMTSLFAACDKENPTLFDAVGNGVYFDYDSEDEMMNDCNFGDYYLEQPTELSFALKIRLLGYLEDQPRTITLKAKPVEGYPEVEFASLPEITFEAGEYEKEVTLTVNRPAEEDVQYASCLYIDSNIGTGVEGFEEFIVYSGIVYKEPETWSNVDDYFGEWSKEKHLYLIDLFQNNNYSQITSLYTLLEAYMYMVDELRAQGDEATLEVPIIYTEDMRYSQPEFWGELQTKYLGRWSSTTYARIASENDVTTKTERAFFDRDEAGMKELNKSAVKIMQAYYDNCYQRELSMASYAVQFYHVPLFADIDYDVTQPKCWSADEPDANAMLEAYYGAYSEAKLKFMLNTLAVQQDGAGWPYAILFPLYKTWSSKTQSYKIDWDYGAPYYYNYFEEYGYGYWDTIDVDTAMKTLNSVFRKADVNGEFDFPVATLGPTESGEGKDDGKGDGK